MSFCCVCCCLTGSAQSRITYHQQQVFLSGSNVAWVNFAHDLGSGGPDIDAFRAIFDSIHAHNGNVMRLWLHTDGTNSPAFDGRGRVCGPGATAIAGMKAILDLARERNIGLMLCLWSFDMLRTSAGPRITGRNMTMLNDTSATRAYITNALIPMVTALKGHPGIQSWEIFNEPEGMSDEFGWDFNRHVPMAHIQRFVNLAAGAIHRVDPHALVTNGAWSFRVQTDIPTAEENFSIVKSRIRTAFRLRYGDEIHIDSLLAAASLARNLNYYRNDRLIAAGGDSLGTLDFYTVHYYSWAGTSISPFHYPCITWDLDKPLAIAEFYVNDTFGKLYRDLYDNLFSNGYAGAMSWSWTDRAVNEVQQFRTKQAMDDLFYHHPWDIDTDPVSGKIYAFRGAVSAITEGDTTTLEWKTSKGTAAALNGTPVQSTGMLRVAPRATTTYRLAASGAAPGSSAVTITVYPSGWILSFAAAQTDAGTHPIKGDGSPLQASVLNFTLRAGEFFAAPQKKIDEIILTLHAHHR